MSGLKSHITNLKNEYNEIQTKREELLIHKRTQEKLVSVFYSNVLNEMNIHNNNRWIEFDFPGDMDDDGCISILNRLIANKIEVCIHDDNQWLKYSGKNKISITSTFKMRYNIELL